MKHQLSIPFRQVLHVKYCIMIKAAGSDYVLNFCSLENLKSEPIKTCFIVNKLNKNM